LVFQYLSPQKKESFNKDFCHMPYQDYINKDHNKSICAAQQAGKFKETNKKNEKKKNKGLLKKPDYRARDR
jgi:hypothetical protein